MQLIYCGVSSKTESPFYLKGLVRYLKRYYKGYVYTEDFIVDCIYKCLNKRYRRKDTAYFFATYVLRYAKSKGTDMQHISLHTVARNCHKLLKTRKEVFDKFIKWIAAYMKDAIYNRTIKLIPIKYQERYDDSSHKLRLIGISSIEQQVYDYIAVYSCIEMFSAKIGYYQCASLPKRGQLYGKNAIEKWIRSNPKKTKWVLKIDIQKCYPSIDHNVLKKYLARDIKNQDILYLLDTLIDTYEQGLCIGSFLSQYLANYYLSYAYHYVNEKMYKTRRGKSIPLACHTLFYMDDILILGNSKSNLRKAFKALKQYLREELKLEIKDTYLLYELTDKRFIDMMGYRTYRKYTTIRRGVFLKSRALFIKYKDPRKPMSIKDARSIASYYGWYKHSNSLKVIKKYKIMRTLKRAKEVISNYDKS